MRYFLAEACQNTFVLFDCLEMKTLDKTVLEEAHEALKKENRDDALILVNGQKEGAFFIAELVVLGLDGEIAEFCGNGARAAAAYLFNHHRLEGEPALKTARGIHPLIEQGPDTYSVSVPAAKFECNPKFVKSLDAFPEYHYVETGEPHLVIEKNMTDEELAIVGKTLNQQKDIFPQGINVNAWHVLGEGKIHVKTYERGVQRLTRSCGTGSMACAAFYQGKGNVEVTTPGGPLEIIFQNQAILLCGEGLVTEVK